MNTTTNFSDIFKSGFLRQAATNLSILDVSISLAIALLLGIFVFFVYKKTYQGILYSKSFNSSLIVLALVTALVIMAISSNVVLSLGMVGALSIVRFRTAIKDPIDIIFMFWAIVIGILTGAGFFMVAIVGSLLIGLILFVFSKAQWLEAPYLLIINATHEADESEILGFLNTKIKHLAIKSKTVSPSSLELTIEFRIMKDDTTMISEVAKLKGITNAVLVSYNGDYVS